MPNKYVAQIRIDNSGSLRESSVYADTEREAIELLRAKHPGMPIDMIREYPIESQEAERSNPGCAGAAAAVVGTVLFGVYQFATAWL